MTTREERLQAILDPSTFRRPPPSTRPSCAAASKPANGSSTYVTEPPSLQDI